MWLTDDEARGPEQVRRHKARPHRYTVLAGETVSCPGCSDSPHLQMTGGPEDMMTDDRAAAEEEFARREEALIADVQWTRK